MIERLRDFFIRIRTYLRITQMTPVARRYLIKNAFDGSMTVLGIVVGAWIVGVTKYEIIVTAGLGACLAMGVSGLFGAYMTERAERKNRLKTLEAAMLADLSNSIHKDASNFASIYAALIDSTSPMLTGIISLIPFIFTGMRMIAISEAYIASLILTLATLFSLGLYLGRIAKENILLYGFQTVASGLLIVSIIFLFGVI
ncbi:MAG: VIT1/CCC1 transporter family protein [Candidatus Hodarchaeota archaeon]